MLRPGGFSSDEESDEGFSWEASPRPPEECGQGDTSKHIEVEEPSPFFIKPQERNELEFMIIGNDIEGLRKFADEGGNLNEFMSRSYRNYTPIALAAFHCYNEVVKFLLEKGVDTLFSPALAVCDSEVKDEKQVVECLLLLIDHGIGLDVVDVNGNSPAILAVKKDRLLLLQVLVAHGCNPFEEDPAGSDCLHHAADRDNLEIVEYLLNIGADKFKMNDEGCVPYDIANNPKVKKLLCINFVLDEVQKLLDEKYYYYSNMSTGEFIMSQLPPKGNRLSGFPYDVIKILMNIGFYRPLQVLIRKNIQLGELLTYDETKWKEIGIPLACERKSLVDAMSLFHKEPFSAMRTSPYLISKYNKNREAFLFGTQCILNWCRQMCIAEWGLSTVIKQAEGGLTLSEKNYLHGSNPSERSRDVPKPFSLPDCVNSSLMFAERMRRDLLTLRKSFEMTERLDCPGTPDFIGPKRKKIPWLWIVGLGLLLTSCTKLYLRR